MEQTTPKTDQVIVAMSGGVDSAVSAYLLAQQGFEVLAIFMKNWEEDDTSVYCSATEDLEDAQRACDLLNIELRTVNFASEYWDNVFERFIADYKKGWTPNPDVTCNKEIKFDVFLEYALSFGAPSIATGHYAGCDKVDGTYRLVRSKDRTKDQTYFLYSLGQKQLAQTMFPLANFQKDEVRKIARHIGLRNSEKPDSTGICFIGERPFRQFLERYLPQTPGEIESESGIKLGTHVGLAFYTLGQRQGLGIGGIAGGSGKPWYVMRKDFQRNVLLVTQGREHPQLYGQRLIIAECNWISGFEPYSSFLASGRLRHGQQDQLCEVKPQGSELFEVIFDQPQWAPTLGQSVVLYKGYECLGGGIIHQVL